MSKSKHIFELSPEEQAERLRTKIAGVQQQNLDAGLYNIFRDAGSADHLVRKYQDRTEVVKVNETTGHTRVIKRTPR